MPLASRSVKLLAGWSATCDRLVHPSVIEPGERQRHCRLLKVALALPFLYGGAMVQLLAGVSDVANLLAVMCALLAGGWSCALILAASARRRLVAAILLLSGTIAAGALVVLGGMASPLALLVLPLVVETAWAGRSRLALGLGVLAAGAALSLPALADQAGLVLPTGYTSSPILWLLPAAYGASIWLRVAPMQRRAPDPAVLPAGAIDALVVTMNAHGDVHDVCERARALVHLPGELLLGDGLFERIHVADRVGYLCALSDIRQGTRSRKVEIRLRLPDGERPGGAYRPFCVELAGAGSGHIVAVLRDNGELVGLREALRSAQQGLESNDIARSRFLAAVSHELRTPLNAIIGFSDMLMHEPLGAFTQARQREYAGLISQSGHHLLSVVNCILDVSKIESGAYTIQPEPFRLAEAVEMCRAMMAQQAEAQGLDLQVDMDADIGEVVADRRAVQQILINLVANAVKFTPEGGRVTIGARRCDGHMHLWVADTGIGIAQDDLARIGEPFTQVHNDYTRRYEGAGLGLSLVKGLVALHEATMTIESSPGEGTTVRIELSCRGPVCAGLRPGAELVPMVRDNTRETGNEALRKSA